MSYRGSKGDGRTYLGNNNAIILIITPIMHSTAGYGGWLMYNAHCTRVGLRLGHVHTTNKPHLRTKTTFSRSPVLISNQVRLTTSTLWRENAPRMGGQSERKEEGDTAPLTAPSSGFITAPAAPLSPFAGRFSHEAVCFLRVWRARVGDECMIQRVRQSWLVHITYLGGSVY